MVNRINGWNNHPLIVIVTLLGTLLCFAGTCQAASAEDPGSIAWRSGDYARAVHHWREAAAGGDHRAQFLLSNAYEQGQGVTKDEAMAAEFLRKAASGGFVPAEFNLGNAYFHGSGVEQNLSAAVMWWRRAAEKDMVGAQFNLGFAYYRGAGVPRDLDEAANWFRKAATGGSLPAATILEEIEANQQVTHGREDQDAETDEHVAVATPADTGVARQETSPETSALPPSSPASVSGETASNMDRADTALSSESSPSISTTQGHTMQTALPPASAPTIDTLGDNDYIVEDEAADESLASVASSGGGVATNSAAETVSRSLPDSPPVGNQSIPRRIYHPNTAMKPIDSPAPPAAERQATTAAPARQASPTPPPIPRQQAQPVTPPPARQPPRQVVHAPAPSAIMGLGWYRQQPTDRYTIHVFGSDDQKEAEAFARSVAKQYPIVGLFAWDNRGEVWHGVSIGDYASSSEAQAARARLPLEEWNHPGWPRAFGEIRRTLVMP